MNTATRNGETVIANGWTLDAAQAAIVESTIDQYRFATRADRTLARIEGDSGFALFPSTDELAAMGVDTEKLAIALRNGLDPVQVGEAVSKLSAFTVNTILDEFQG